MKHININKFNVGKFNERVVVQQAIQTADNAGGFVLTWQPLRTIWGFVQQHNSAEKIIGEANRLTQQMTLIIRAQSGLNSKMRCVIAGNIYAIIAMHPKNDMPQSWLELKLELIEGI